VGARASRTHGQRRARGGGSSSRVYPARSGARAHGPAGRSHYGGVGWPGGGALGREGGGGAQVRERDGGAQSSRGGEGRGGKEERNPGGGGLRLTMVPAAAAAAGLRLKEAS